MTGAIGSRTIQTTKAAMPTAMAGTETDHADLIIVASVMPEDPASGQHPHRVEPVETGRHGGTDHPKRDKREQGKQVRRRLRQSPEQRYAARLGRARGMIDLRGRSTQGRQS